MEKQVQLDGLRRERRSWSLTQKELALLMDAGSATFISRVERHQIVPNMRMVIATHILFGIRPEQLFPSLYDEMEDGVLRGAYHLFQKLEHVDSPKALRKRELMERVMARAVKRNSKRSNI